MPKVIFLPNREYCPDGLEVQANSGESILDIALQHGIEMEHACEKSCACSTCHCIVKKGFDSLGEPSEREEDMLDKACGVEPNSRLGCQAKLGTEDITVEIPRYTLNHARE